MRVLLRRLTAGPDHSQKRLARRPRLADAAADKPNREAFMRRFRVLAATALAVGAVSLVTTAPASAATVTVVHSCSSTSVANPILGTPGCIVATVCPAATLCDLPSSTVTASSLVSIGRVGGTVNLF